MTHETERTPAADAGPVERGVGRPVEERCKDCALLLAPGRSWYCTRCALQHISED